LYIIYETRNGPGSLPGYPSPSTLAKHPDEGDEGWRVGRDNAILTEPTSSHEKCLKTRTPSPSMAVPPPHLRGLPGIGPRRPGAISGVRDGAKHPRRGLC